MAGYWCKKIKGKTRDDTLRHTYRTVADKMKDQPAADFIMGNEVPHMSSVYRPTKKSGLRVAGIMR